MVQKACETPSLKKIDLIPLHTLIILDIQMIAGILTILHMSPKWFMSGNITKPRSLPPGRSSR